MFLKISLTLAVCAYLVNLPLPAAAINDCGQVVNQNLKSPGWPDEYSHNIENCHYSVAIPSGKDLVVYFHFFDVETGSSCPFDHLDISNPAQSKRFCGNHTGETYLVKGNYANINFVTDVSVTKAGYDLYFIFVDPLPSSVSQKRSFVTKLNMKSDDVDEAQDRRIKDAVKTFMSRRSMKEQNHKKPEVIPMAP